MRYILDNNGYIEAVSCTEISCSNKSCTAYTGAIPEGYDSLEDWAQNANIRAYKIVDGNLTYDDYEDEYLKAIYEEETIAGLVGKSIVQMTLKNDITNYATDSNYFHPFSASGNNEVIAIGKKIQYGQRPATDYGGRTNQTVYGVLVGEDVPYVKVSPTIRYLNNSTSSVNINTYIYVVRDGTSKAVKASSDTVPASSRYTAAYTHIVDSLQSGDFIFIVSYKSTASRDVDVISSNSDTSVLFETLC